MEIIEAEGEMEDESKTLLALRKSGDWRVNGRGYVECHFDGMELTASVSARDPSLLSFHVWQSAIRRDSSSVFRCTHPPGA